MTRVYPEWVDRPPCSWWQYAASFVTRWTPPAASHVGDIDKKFASSTPLYFAPLPKALTLYQYISMIALMSG